MLKFHCNKFIEVGYPLPSQIACFHPHKPLYAIANSNYIEGTVCSNLFFFDHKWIVYHLFTGALVGQTVISESCKISHVIYSPTHNYKAAFTEVNRKFEMSLTC